MSEMKEGVQSYTEGVDSYVSGGSKLAEGTVAYVKGTSSLTDYMKKYIKGSSALSDSMVRYLEEIKTLLSSMDILIPGMDETLKDTKAAADKNAVTQYFSGCRCDSGSFGKYFRICRKKFLRITVRWRDMLKA